MNPSSEREAVVQRITDYLSCGGLFNPELANHDAVRDLLIDCRAALSTQPQQAVAWATMNEEGEPAMLFFDKQEARHYCGEDEEPRPLGFIDLPPVPGQEGGS